MSVKLQHCSEAWDRLLLIAVRDHRRRPPGSDFALTRYDADGTLDSSFSGDGKQTTDLGGSYDSGQSVAIQADGKIVVAGYSYQGAARSGSRSRYDPDGTLDSSFSGDGKETTNLGRWDYGQAVAIQADGKIVVAGASAQGTFRDDQGYDYDDYDFALARYNADGTLDTSFSGDGKETTAFIDVGASIDEVQAIAVQADGKIVVAGHSQGLHGYSVFALARYDPGGSLDATFSGDATSLPAGPWQTAFIEALTRIRALPAAA